MPATARRVNIPRFGGLGGLPGDAGLQRPAVAHHLNRRRSLSAKGWRAGWPSKATGVSARSVSRTARGNNERSRVSGVAESGVVSP